MATTVKHAFSGFFSQLVVVCLLALFIAVALVAMLAGGTSETEWIGMTVKALGAEAAAAKGIPSGVGGVMVEDVEGLAARAGVRQGDVIQGINGKAVQDLAGFSELAGKTDLSKGATQLAVNRRGMQIPIVIFPAAVIQGRGQTTPGGIAQAPTPLDRRWLGIDAETLAGGEGRTLGIPAGVAGVLIDGVTQGSQAQRAGLTSNDVIVSVNGQRVDSTAGLWSTLAGLNGDGSVEFGVYRNGQLLTVALPTAQGAQAGGFARPGCWGWGADGAPIYATPAGAFGGRMGGQGLGPGGTLVCPRCGTTVAHQRGVACYTVPCPACGTQMIRVQ